VVRSSLDEIPPLKIRAANDPDLRYGLAYGQRDRRLPGRGSGWVDSGSSKMVSMVTTGGTNLRVCQVTLGGEGKFEITQTKYKVTEEQKLDDGSKLCSSTSFTTTVANQQP
jgi:hypothetical protein